MDKVYLDTETTGLNEDDHRIVEISIVGQDGDVLLDSLVNPGREIPARATEIHGITDEMVRDAPTLEQLETAIIKAIRGKELVIYNSEFDCWFLPQKVLDSAGKISCAMLRFSSYMEEEDEYGGLRRHRLSVAAQEFGHNMTNAHRALPDAIACRAVDQNLDDRHEEIGDYIRSLS